MSSSAAVVPTTHTIVECTHVCLQAFDRTLEFLNDHGLRKFWVQVHEQYMRLNLWTSNTGVFAEFHFSMDYRLRNLPEARELLISNVEKIIREVRSIEKLLMSSELMEGDHDARLEKPEWLINASDEYDKSLQSVQSAISWLHRLSNVIRRASVRRQNEKIVAIPTDEKAKQAYIEERERYEPVYGFYLDRDFPLLKQDQFMWLRRRLTSSMHVRRLRIQYRRDRQEVIKVPRIERAMVGTTLPPTADPVPQSVTASNSVRKEKLQPSTIAKKAVARGPATSIKSKDFRRAYTPSKASGAVSIALGSQAKLVIPPSPIVGPDEQEFVCPYCSQIRPRAEATNKLKWSEHVKKDSDPYVCLFEKCQDNGTSPELFSSTAQWLSHMREQHLSFWRCTMCSSSIPTFGTELGFVQHLRTHHKDVIEEETLDMLCGSCRSMDDQIFPACPLCSKETRTLETHVAEHLQYLALLSLPLPDGDDTRSSVALSQRSDTSHRGPSKQRSTIRKARTARSDDSHGFGFPTAKGDTVNAEPSLTLYLDPFDNSVTLTASPESTLPPNALNEGRVGGIRELTWSNILQHPHTILSQLDHNRVSGVRLPDFQPCTFVPAHSQLLESIFFSDESMLQTLQHISAGKADLETASLVRRGASIILCILLKIGEAKLIDPFIVAGAFDADLPFGEDEPCFAYSNVTHDTRTAFLREQWSFIAQPLTRDTVSQLAAERILPIETCTELAQGSTSRVYKIIVNPGYDQLNNHHVGTGTETDPGPERHVYALKQFDKIHLHDFEIELKAVQALRKSMPPEFEITESLGAFESMGMGYLVFEYADHGSLEDYFAHETPPITAPQIHAFWRNLSEVVEVLTILHAHQDFSQTETSNLRHGWHHDIKPANILVFSRRKSEAQDNLFKFKLADMALTTFEHRSNVDEEPKTLVRFGTRTYGAPEVSRILAQPGSDWYVTQKIDIWSIACVFCVAGVWINGGTERLNVFSNDRAHDSVRQTNILEDSFHDGRSVLPSVLNWLFDTQSSREQAGDSLTASILHEVMLILASKRTYSMKDFSNALKEVLETFHHTSEGEESKTLDVPTTDLEMKEPNSLNVSEATNDDNSIITVSSNTLEALSLFRGDTVLVKGKDDKDTVLIVLTDDDLSDNSAGINHVARHNLRVTFGDTIAVDPCPDIKHTKRAAIVPFADTVEGLIGSIFDGFLAPYFREAYRPVREGDLFTVSAVVEYHDRFGTVTSGMRQVQFKVVELDPPTMGIIAQDTIIHCEGEPLRRGDEDSAPNRSRQIDPLGINFDSSSLRVESPVTKNISQDITTLVEGDSIQRIAEDDNPDRIQMIQSTHNLALKVREDDESAIRSRSPSNSPPQSPAPRQKRQRRLSAEQQFSTKSSVSYSNRIGGYRVDRATLESYLLAVFPNLGLPDFEIKSLEDRWVFWAPRPVTMSELEEFYSSSGYVEDSFPAYRLPLPVLRDFLQRTFSDQLSDNVHREINVLNDRYVFRIPRLLTENERDSLDKLRDDPYRFISSQSPEYEEGNDYEDQELGRTLTDFQFPPSGVWEAMSKRDATS